MRSVTTAAILLGLSGSALALGTATPPIEAARVTSLIQLVAPDLSVVDGQSRGTSAVPIRSLPYPEDPPVEDFPLAFFQSDAIVFRNAGTTLLALLLPADPARLDPAFGTLLGVFDPEREALVDVADVATDRQTGYAEPAVLSLSPDTDGVLIANSHSNSSQTYRSIAVVALVEGRLKEVASVFTLSELHCGLERTQIATFEPLEGDGAWSPFVVRIEETTRLPPEDCGTLPDATAGTRSVAVTMHWNPDEQRYEPDTDALDQLYEETEARF